MGRAQRNVLKGFCRSIPPGLSPWAEKSNDAMTRNACLETILRKPFGFEPLRALIHETAPDDPCAERAIRAHSRGRNQILKWAKGALTLGADSKEVAGRLRSCARALQV